MSTSWNTKWLTWCSVAHLFQMCVYLWGNITAFVAKKSTIRISTRYRLITWRNPDYVLWLRMAPVVQCRVRVKNVVMHCIKCTYIKRIIAQKIFGSLALCFLKIKPCEQYSWIALFYPVLSLSASHSYLTLYSPFLPLLFSTPWSLLSY